MKWDAPCRRMVGVTVAIMLVAGLGWPAGAEEYNVQKDTTLYGNLNQNLIPGIGACACGPTAAVNSLVYLENAYPGIYNRSLVPDTMAPFSPNPGHHNLQEMVAVGTILGNAAHMATVCPAGTWDDMFIYGKHTYIETALPNKTVYGAQMSGNWQNPPVAAPNWVQQNTLPTWQFLYNNLEACEDVEILIVDEPWGHFLTLTSFLWNDANNNQVVEVIFDPDTGQWVPECNIDYIDPCNGQVGVSPMWQNAAGGQLFVSYPNVPNARLVMAMSESPIPEPGTLVLLCMGGLCLLGYGWRRWKRAA